MARFVVGAPLILLLASVASAQNLPQSDPRALNLVSQITALSGGTSISDITLRGTATRSNGSKRKTDNATMMAKVSGESRFDMTLSAGPPSNICNDASTTAKGELLATAGSATHGIPELLGQCHLVFPGGGLAVCVRVSALPRKNYRQWVLHLTCRHSPHNGAMRRFAL